MLLKRKNICYKNICFCKKKKKKKKIYPTNPNDVRTFFKAPETMHLPEELGEL
jgi:hypothetical protein